MAVKHSLRTVPEDTRKQIEQLIADAKRGAPPTTPLTQEIFAVVDGLMLRGVSQEKAAYTVGLIFQAAYQGGSPGVRT